jgi:hypothetical protein
MIKKEAEKILKYKDLTIEIRGHVVVQLVEALRYKLEVCGFDSSWCHWNFSLTILSAALWPWD